MVKIADSNITKRALAEALKELMAEMPFAKISISDICEKCNMNRKSFYYHYKDKYDLVNWIFDTEFIAIADKKSYEQELDFILDLCQYFYENHRFYRSALQIQGQNSFSQHFQELLRLIAMTEIKEIFEGQEILDFYVNLLVDGFVCAIMRWIMEKEPVAPEEFVGLIQSFIRGLAVAAYQKMSEQ